MIKILALIIFFLAAFFRLYGINWDQNQHLHPDERFLTMVATGLEWPKSFAEYLDTDISPLNPHNRGHNFFVYGTFPIFFTKLVADIFGMDDYVNLTLIGRTLSALFDLGTVVLVFLIGKQISTNNKNYPINTNKPINQLSNKEKVGNWKLEIGNWFIPLWGMFFYACMVLPIQLSHFYAVDTYLTFFLTLSFYFLTLLFGNSQFAIRNSIFLSISFGLAIASKISALLFLPIIGLTLVIILIKKRQILFPLGICCLLFVVCYLTVRLAQPYLFAQPQFFDITLNPKVLDNWRQLKSFEDPSGWFPPGVQWITTKPYAFPLKNMVFWGLGLPMGILSVISILYFVSRILYRESKRKYQVPDTNYQILFLCLLWIIFLFGYQGSQFVKAMRYFYPIYPFLAILSAFFTVHIMNYFLKRFHIKSFIGFWGYWILGVSILIYPLSFVSIYSRPHTRVAASRWIYRNVSPGSLIPGEHWDDFLPVNLADHSSSIYSGIEFGLYGSDTEEKWKDLSEKLQRVDYIILSSNRLYGSIMTVPEKYPITTRYYTMLFDGSLGFEKVAEFTSRPNIPFPFISLCLTPPFARYGLVAKENQECPLPGISFVDDYADESFTVYDHPKVIIFKKVRPMDYMALYEG